jgi:manganese/iron transport system ATP-binding protein
LGGETLHEDADSDTRTVTILTDDERPFVQYGELTVQREDDPGERPEVKR